MSEESAERFYRSGTWRAAIVAVKELHRGLRRLNWEIGDIVLKICGPGSWGPEGTADETIQRFANEVEMDSKEVYQLRKLAYFFPPIATEDRPARDPRLSLRKHLRIAKEPYYAEVLAEVRRLVEEENSPATSESTIKHAVRNVELRHDGAVFEPDPTSVWDNATSYVNNITRKYKQNRLVDDVEGIMALRKAMRSALQTLPNFQR